jgi:hypothetical protein
VSCYLLGGIEENDGEVQSVLPVAGQRFEPVTSPIRSRQTDHSVGTLGFAIKPANFRSDRVTVSVSRKTVVKLNRRYDLEASRYFRRFA